jgi:aspartate/tyrosine/aromatic aminotransferase
MSFFETVTQLPDDAILQLPIAFAADPRPNKVNLGIGSYRDAAGKSMELTCVRKAEKVLAAREVSKEYLPIEGLESFLQASAELVFGKDIVKGLKGTLFLAQGLGGTGSLRLGGEFLVQETSKAIFIPSPSWPNHKAIFGRCGLKVHYYRYFDEVKHALNFEGMCEDIESMPPGSVLLLQAGCHNPTGIDPTFEQWQHLSLLLRRQNIIPFFDFAYQGFANAVDEDARAIRYFVEQGHEILVANSFSKNFGLYNERAGMLSVVTSSRESARKVGSQVKQIIRNNYSNPPRHGVQIISDILASESLRKEWLQELGNMRSRIEEMRIAFEAGLQSRYEEIDWSYIGQQKGFFSYFGLNKEHVQCLLRDYAIYMPSNGRINIAGLNIHNLDYVIESVVDVIGS